MSQHRSLSRAAAALAEATGQTHTRCLYALRGGDDAPWPILPAGARVKFFQQRPGQPVLFTIRAVSDDGRFVICTRGAGEQTQYTVVDMRLGIRGTSDSYGTGFVTDADIAESMQSLLDGVEVEEHGKPVRQDEYGPVITAQVSVRNWVWLRMAPTQPDPRIQPLLPWLAQVMALAPRRDRNDFVPRTPQELQARLRGA